MLVSLLLNTSLKAQVYSYTGNIPIDISEGDCEFHSSVNYDITMKHLDNGECGSWLFSVIFPQLSNGSTYDPKDEWVGWRNIVTHEVEYGDEIPFRVSSPIAYIELSFIVEVTCNNNHIKQFKITTGPFYISQNETCNIGRSVLNYCDMTRGCITQDFLNHYDRLSWLFLYDPVNEECIELNSTNNPGNIFRFPYKIYSDGNCELTPPDPDLWDFVDDLNTYLSTFGHTGHAFIKHYSVPFECKMKIKLVDSDLVLHKVYHNCYKLFFEEDEYGLCQNPQILFDGLAPRHRAEVEEFAGVDLTELWLCPGPGGIKNHNNDNDIYDDLIPDFDFVIYPSIVNDELSMEWNYDQDSKYILSIYNMGGKLMLSKILDGKVLKEKIDIKDYKPGLYFISVSSELTGNKKVLKFVKQ